MDYYRDLKGITDILTTLTKRVVRTIGDMALVTTADSLTLDATKKLTPAQQSRLRKLMRVIAEQEERYDEIVTPADMITITRRASRRTDALNKRSVKTQLQKTVGLTRVDDPSTASIRGQWTKKNISLIKTIGPNHFKRLEGLVEEGFQRGSSFRTVQKQIIEVTGVTKRRAALIARDQIGSLNSELTRKRHMENGISKFRWHIADSERARDDHKDLDGTVHSYKDGAPVEGFPGGPIQCRCTAEPLL